MTLQGKFFFISLLWPLGSFLLSAQTVDLFLSTGLIVLWSYLLVSFFFHPLHAFDRDPFHPVALLKPVLAIVIIGGILQLLNNHSFEPEDLLPLALVGLVSALLVDFLGILLRKPPQPRSGTLARRKTENRWTVPFLLGVLVVGWVWRLHSLGEDWFVLGTYLGTQSAVRPFGGLVGILHEVATLGFLGLVVFSRWRFFLFAAGVAEIGWQVLSGSKAALLFVVVPVLLVLFHSGRWRPGRKMTFWLLSGLLLFLLVFGYVSRYRAISQRSIQAVGFVTHSPLAAAVEAFPERTDYSGLLAQLAERATVSRNLALLLRYAEESGIKYRNGATVFPVLVWFVPRALWPDKPVVSIGHWFASTVLGWDYASRSEAAITVWGDGFLNFGVFGLLAFPALWFGIVIVLYERLAGGGPWSLLALASIYVTLIQGMEQNIAVPLVEVMKTLSMVWLIFLGVRFFARVSSRENRMSSEDPLPS